MRELMRPLAVQHSISDCDYCGRPVDLTDGGHLYRMDAAIGEKPDYVCESCRYPFECMACGDLVDKLHEVTDEDRSVGYSATIQVGECCLRRRP